MAVTASFACRTALESLALATRLVRAPVAGVGQAWTPRAVHAAFARWTSDGLLDSLRLNCRIAPGRAELRRSLLPSAVEAILAGRSERAASESELGRLVELLAVLRPAGPCGQEQVDRLAAVAKLVSGDGDNAERAAKVASADGRDPAHNERWRPRLGLRPILRPPGPGEIWSTRPTRAGVVAVLVGERGSDRRYAAIPLDGAVWAASATDIILFPRDTDFGARLRAVVALHSWLPRRAFHRPVGQATDLVRATISRGFWGDDRTGPPITDDRDRRLLCDDRVRAVLESLSPVHVQGPA